jgi:hypothetical protein
MATSKLTQSLLAFLLLALACNKEQPTVVVLYIIDLVTREPITAGGTAVININYTGTKPVNIDNSGVFRYSSYTDFGIYGIDVGLEYDARVLPPICHIDGETCEDTLEMVPLDCTLNLHVKHSNPMTDSTAFFLASNNTIRKYNPLKIIAGPAYAFPSNPAIIPLDTESIFSFRSKGDEFTYLHFDTIPSTTGSATSIPIVDSIFIERGEMKDYYIEF